MGRHINVSLMFQQQNPSFTISASVASPERAKNCVDYRDLSSKNIDDYYHEFEAQMKI